MAYNLSQSSVERLNELLQKQAGLLQKRENLLSRPTIKFSALQRVTAELNKTNDALLRQRNIVSAGISNTLQSSLVHIGQAALFTTGALAAASVAAEGHFNPGAVVRFKYRLGDLAAVVGSILDPAFNKLIDTTFGLSKWLYNLSPTTKGLASDFAAMVVPIAALAGATWIGVGAFRVFLPLLRGVRALYALGAVNKAGLALGGPSLLRSAAPALVGGGIGGLIGQQLAQASGAGVGGQIAGGVIGAGAGALAGRAAGAAFAAPQMYGPAMRGATGMAGTSGGVGYRAFAALSSTGAGATLAKGGVYGAIALVTAALADQLKYKLTGKSFLGYTGPKARGVEKDPTNLDAQREVTEFSSVLDPGRRLRQQSLMLTTPSESGARQAAIDRGAPAGEAPDIGLMNRIWIALDGLLGYAPGLAAAQAINDQRKKIG